MPSPFLNYIGLHVRHVDLWFVLGFDGMDPVTDDVLPKEPARQ